VAGALAAVEVQDFPRDERGGFEEQHGVNDAAPVGNEKLADMMVLLAGSRRHRRRSPHEVSRSALQV